MKVFNVKSLVLALATMLCTTVWAETPEMEGNAVNNEVKAHRILVLSAMDNVTSNYFVTDMLAENTNIQEDSVCYVYNKVIEDNLEALAQKAKLAYNFVNGNKQTNASKLLENVRTVGEDENKSSDLSFVNSGELKELLADAGADYLLLLDAHYLKYQELPFKTIFHYVNYSLYDANKEKLAHGSNYFTSINPQTEDQMVKSSKKSTAKMLDLVINTLTK